MGVADEDRTDDIAVLFLRTRQSSLGPELRLTKRRQPSTQSAGEFGDVLVVSACIDERMKRQIGRGKAVAVISGHDLGQGLMRALQPPPFDRRHAHRRQAGACSLNLGHGAEQRIRLRRSRARLRGAAAAATAVSAPHDGRHSGLERGRPVVS
jgi:hypothetical protein